MKLRQTVIRSMFLLAALLTVSALNASDTDPGGKVTCANLVYAVNKSSVCFSDRFLQRLELETNVNTEPRFVRIKLDSNDLYQHPFAVMTGEGGFTLTPRERLQLQQYVTHGGFLLASAGCSDPQWTRSFRSEIGRIFPGQKMVRIPLSHPLYHTVYSITSVYTTHAHRGAGLEGLTQNGKIVIVFSPDGLNDTSHAENCCCCGGDELDQAERINANILAYALLH